MTPLLVILIIVLIVVAIGPGTNFRNPIGVILAILVIFLVLRLLGVV